MVHVTTFLLRWLYLSNLIRDMAEIQSLPHYPPHLQQIQHEHDAHSQQQQQDGTGSSSPLHYGYADGYGQQQQHQSQISTPAHSTGHQQPHQYHPSYSQSHQLHPHPPPPPPPLQQFQPSSLIQNRQPATNAHAHNHHYQQQQPQNHQQPRRDDEMEWRKEALKYITAYPPGTERRYALDVLRLKLILKLRNTMNEADRLSKKVGLANKNMGAGADLKWGTRRRPGQSLERLEEGRAYSTERDDEDDDLDADNTILSEYRTATTPNTEDMQSSGPNDVPSESSQGDVQSAQSLRKEVRDYLPQLIAAVLHSPPALMRGSHVDPLASLRTLLVDRCLVDPNLGIDLCWLLEAEVGRAWKIGFEEFQRTGRRLIIVAPADKAAILAKIGMEKAAAFDLLQDAEQATAFGCHETYSQEYSEDAAEAMNQPSPPRLPSSLSQRRCSHFGDTMHFMDRLTQLSLDLRRVPALQRLSYLKESLIELNRRLRRRMYTEGEISLDVEDNRGAYDWPMMEDINLGMLKHSVHFPLEPKSVTWPGPNDYASSGQDGGVMRVLNIVTDDARIMASRERCPFLVHLEVAETGLEGSDARLYTAGTKDVALSVEEALGIGTDALQNGESNDSPSSNDGGFATYQIPRELLAWPLLQSISQEVEKEMTTSGQKINLPRGGWHGDGWDGDVPSPHDMMRQEQIEQLHQAMHVQSPADSPKQPEMQHHSTDDQQTQSQGPILSTGKFLLNKVFGLPWDIRCNEIRRNSSYGKVKGWRLASFIMKAGEDIRREAMVMQIISKMKSWFDAEIPEEVRPYLRPYTIMCIGGDAGVVECVHDAKSVDDVKKQTDGYTSLRDFFERAYGLPGSAHAASTLPNGDRNENKITFEQAQDNFLRSLVGYSLVCYVLQIKDRHNANILMTREGHLMHIDYGFVLGDTPKMAKVPLFTERAPFKLTQEFWDVIGGWNIREGGLGVKFCIMFEAAFACASSHADEIASLVEAAVLNLISDANKAKKIGDDVRSRLRMRGPPNSPRQKNFIVDLVNAALLSWGTSSYDGLQRFMNGYQ